MKNNKLTRDEIKIKFQEHNIKINFTNNTIKMGFNIINFQSEDIPTNLKKLDKMISELIDVYNDSNVIEWSYTLGNENLYGDPQGVEYSKID